MSVFWIAVVALCTLIAEPATAAPEDGLYFEQRAEAGGVEVRRMRDTSNGVVCYVAKGQIIGYRSYEATGEPVAISCVKAER